MSERDQKTSRGRAGTTRLARAALIPHRAAPPRVLSQAPARPMTTQPQLNLLLGATRELDLTRSNDFVRALLRRLAEDPEPIFRATVSGLPRTRRSLATIGLITHFMVRDHIDAGHLSVDEAYLIFLCIVFVLVIDDHMDTVLDPAVTPVEEVEGYTRRLLHACHAEGSPGDADPIIRIIQEIGARLRRYPAYDAYRGVYLQALASMLDGMIQEYRHRDPHAVNLDHYMTYASHSVGITLGLTASLILLGDRALVAHIDRLWVVYEIVAAIIRFANDIRSYERELAEGKFSSFQLAAKKYGIALDEVNFNQHDIIRIIRAMMVAEVYDLKDALQYLHSAGARFEAIIINAVLGVVSLYEIADFHTLRLEDP